MTIEQPLDQPVDRSPAQGAMTAPAIEAPGRPPSRTRTVLVGGGLLISALAVAGLLLWLPWGERNDFGYDSIAPIRDTAWLGIALDGFAFGLLAITASLATCMLAPARGRRWAEVGAVVTIVGGLAFAMGAFARGAVSWFASDPALGADTGRTLLALIEGEPGRLLLVAMAGFLLVTVGMLVLAVAWWRSRSVPRWLPIALAALTVAQFTVFEGRALDVLQILVMLVLAAFAIAFLRRRPVG